MEYTDVIVIGGGIAGVRAALDLTDRGHSVVLCERLPALGGRAGSFLHSKEGWIDSGQHVYLGCCHAFRSLLEDLGTAHLAPLTRRLDFTLIDGANAGRSAPLRAARLPYPLSLAAAIGRYRHFTTTERIKTFAVLAKAWKDWTFDQVRLASISFADWLGEAGVSVNSREALWDPLIIATLNDTPERVSADGGVMVLVKALLRGSQSAAVGIPRVPLTQLFQPLVSTLGEESVRLDTPVHTVVFDEGRAVGVALEDGSTIKSRAVIIATDWTAVHRLVPPAQRAKDRAFDQIARLNANPIVNLHLWFDRPITDRLMVGFIRSPLQWLFSLSLLYQDSEPDLGWHYTISISDAADLFEHGQDDITATMVSELRRLLPEAARARLRRSAVRKMARATFACPPNSRQWRPKNALDLPGLFLAGDYTDTGWPATMEAAAISGQSAAEAASAYVAAEPGDGPAATAASRPG